MKPGTTVRIDQDIADLIRFRGKSMESAKEVLHRLLKPEIDKMRKEEAKEKTK